MLCAPLAGLVVGVAAAAFGGALLLLGGGPLLAAVGTAAVPAALTRGLHLDGLADTADGLGSGKPAEDALRIMKQSDIGPFGVITLLFALLAQVAALGELYAQSWGHGVLAAVTAAVTARCALTLASRTGVPAARPEGLGAAVAGTVPAGAALLCAALVDGPVRGRRRRVRPVRRTARRTCRTARPRTVRTAAPALPTAVRRGDRRCVRRARGVRGTDRPDRALARLSRPRHREDPPGPH